ncbi:inactive tyrosine-protein kinase transmembrane receptor ROR1 [Ciona intestinalis]
MKRHHLLWSLLAILSHAGILIFATGPTSSSDVTPTDTSNDETGNQDGGDTEERDPFLRIIGKMNDLKLVSDGEAKFRCRVDAWPNDNIKYTWYKDNYPIDFVLEGSRISVSNKPTGSRLRIRNLLSTDSGTYMCEASNRERSASTSAKLTVSFRLPPDDGHKTKIPKGKCETYAGQACRSLMNGKSIYVDPFMTQEKMEQEISGALQHITNSEYVSDKCKRYAFPAFCSFVYAPCELHFDPLNGKKKATPVKLCREDCELMKYDICRTEFLNSADDKFLEDIFLYANCSYLPPTTSHGTKCTKVGLPATTNKAHICYNETGTSYRGTARFTQNGQICKAWPVSMIAQYPELSGGHNFCRNPGNKMSAPWCYTDQRVSRMELCDLDKCSVSAKGSDMIIILIPSIAIPFIIGCIAIAFCICRKKKNQNDQGSKPNPEVAAIQGKPIKMSQLTVRTMKLPQLGALSVNFLGDMGDGQFGKVYKAKILPNPHYNTNSAAAVKTLRENALPSQVDEFHREVEVYTELQNENVACLKAIVFQPNLRCMVFEYTDGIDLHEYLVLHSPQADFAKPPSSASSHASSSIEHADFIRMAIQVASGMDYLTRNNFIHRDLSARNVLVCGNLDLKICNLGVIRDSYLSCYYRNPQGGQMLPIRWMAPESIHSWQFSDKSAVWSFGVLLWEMFSYGLQPYCGYSNHEVLDMISRRQLLTCPDQCPAKVYSLMHECWCGQPNQRPSFKELLSKLQGWEGTSTTRVTSHLAQGIHRQLTNVMRDGNEYTHFPPQASSVGGSSGITYSSAIPAPTPSPPPQFVGSFPMPCSSASTFMANQPIPPNVSPSSQQYFSSPGTTVSYPNSNNQQYHAYQAPPYPQGNQYNNYQQHPPVSQAYQGNQMLQRRPQQYRKGPPSHSSSSSCTSSGREQYPPHPRQQYNQRHHNNEDYQDGYNYSQQRPPPPFSGPGNRPLSGVMEDVDDHESKDESFYQNQRLLPQNNQPQDNSHNGTDSNVTSPSSGQHLLEGDSSDMSTASVKATSCDSGLPVDDENHVVDPKTPMVSRGGQRVSIKTPQRVVTPRKFT